MLDTGIGILQQWLSAATLAETDVTDERGVVLDEWRQSVQSSSGRLFEAIAELFFTDTPYAGRDPIGSDTAIEAMTPDVLRRFYDEWYRPDNAAIVIVGDIDVDQVEAKVTELFAGLTDRGTGQPRPALSVGPYAAPKASVVTDPDVVDSFAELTLPAGATPQDTPAAVQQSVFVDLGMEMIANRLADDATRGEAEFAGASVDSNSHVRALDAPSVLVSANADATAAALDAVLVEFERVARDGFDEVELARVVEAWRSSVESAHDGAATTQDVDYAATYVNSFLTGAPYLDAEVNYALYSAILDSASAANVADALAARRAAAAPHVLISAPEGTTLPTDAEVLTLLDEVTAREIEPRAASEAVDTELMTAPAPVEEESRAELAGDPGVFLEPTELSFANGVRFVLNQTKIVEGTVALGASSSGGSSLVADADVPDAFAAPYLVPSSGLGPLDPVQAGQVLAATSVDLQPFLDSTSENWFGSASTVDLETMFQVLHLEIAEPRFDQTALDTLLDQIRPYVEQPDSDPDFAGQSAFARARYGDEPRLLPLPTTAELDTIDLAGVERVWRDRFGDASDWTFVLSGDFELDEAIDLARSYLGTLPSTGRTEDWVDVQPAAPAGVVTEDVRAGTGDRATLTVGWSEPATSTDGLAVLTAQVLSSVLDSRLVDHIREQLGATYSPSAFVSVLTEPDPLFETSISITGAPDGMAEISTILQQDLATLRDDGPTDAELAAALEELDNTINLISNEQLIDVLLPRARRRRRDRGVPPPVRRCRLDRRGGGHCDGPRRPAGRPLHRDHRTAGLTETYRDSRTTGCAARSAWREPSQLAPTAIRVAASSGINIAARKPAPSTVAPIANGPTRNPTRVIEITAPIPCSADTPGSLAAATNSAGKAVAIPSPPSAQPTITVHGRSTPIASPIPPTYAIAPARSTAIAPWRSTRWSPINRPSNIAPAKATVVRPATPSLVPNRSRR